MANYFLDNYGTCIRQPQHKNERACVCLRDGWLGVMCPYWRPLGARNWEELKAISIKEVDINE